MTNIRFRNIGLSLAVIGSLALTACEDSPTEPEEHGDPETVQLVLNGTTIASFSFATNTWTGEMEVEVGEETDHIDVEFLDEDDDVITFDSDFYLEVDVADETIAEFEQDTPGEFGGHLHGVAEGETDVIFMLMHGAVGSGHADATTTAVHAHVEAATAPSF